MTDLRVILLTISAIIFLFGCCWCIDNAMLTKHIYSRVINSIGVVVLATMCVLIGIKAINHYKCNAGNCIEVNIIGAFYGR